VKKSPQLKLDVGFVADNGDYGYVYGYARGCDDGYENDNLLCRLVNLEG